MSYLPNKSAQGRPAPGWRIGFLVFFILLVFAGWFYFSDYKNTQSQYIAEKEKSPLVVALDTTSQLDADSDGDGLKDWEELLWKTDSSKVDTDGDGTNDNEEITLGRNPLKAGPDDKISDKEDLIAQEKAVSDGQQNTLTAVYARKFFTDYMALKTQKEELTVEDKNNLVEKFMGDIKPLVAVDEYSIADIKIASDTNDAIKKYASEMKKIFIDESQELVDAPMVFELLFKNIKEGNPDFQKMIIERLNYSAGQYEELIKKLIIPIVPKELSKNHLEAVNGLNNIKFAIKNMTLAPEDPVKAMMGKKLYDIEIQRTHGALKNTQNIFDNYGIYVF